MRAPILEYRGHARKKQELVLPLKTRSNRNHNSKQIEVYSEQEARKKAELRANSPPKTESLGTTHHQQSTSILLCFLQQTMLLNF